MPYDELGNYVPGDDTPSIDEMKYELAKKEARRKAETVSDLLDRYVSDPIRGISTAGSEIIKRLPGADLAQAAMNIGSGLFAPAAAVPYSIYKGIESGEYGRSTDTAGRQFEDIMRELTYEPRTQGGRDIMEGIAKAIEVTKLPPYIGHIYSPRVPLSADDVRVLAKRGIETGREIAAIPEDFLAAQQGLRRESNLGGTTYGAKLQSVAEDIGDVAARRAAMRADEGRVPRPGSVEVFSDLVPETNMYAVRPTGGQLVKAVDPITGELRELDQSSVAGIGQVYENLRKPTEGQGLINQYMRNFVNRPGLETLWEDFNAKKVAEEFPKAPSPSDAREAFQVKYPTTKARNERMIQQFDEFSQLPDVQAAAETLGISIPTFEDYQKRIEAANTWSQKGFTNYLQKYLGTKEDPALAAATQGITFKDPERLTENAVTALNYASVSDLRKERKAAGYNEEGEVQPFLKEKMTELKAVDDQLREMVTKRNVLYEQARQQNVDPASNPEYAELTNKLASKVAEKERITQQAENYKLGKSYETIADLAVEPRTAAQLKKKLSYAESQLFPYLDKTPDEATLYDVDPTLVERLGYTELAEMFMDDIISGKIPIDKIGNVSIPKYIQQHATARMAKEAQAKKDLAAQQKVFDNYLQNVVQEIPSNKIFGNAAALEITNAMSENDIIRHLSTDTEVLDHCVGTGGQGRRGRQHVPILNPATGEVPAGSSGEPNTGYVRGVLNKGNKIVSFRDTVSGKPVGTLELQKRDDGMFDIGYASGYQNGRMQSTYTESLANYLNSIDSDINGSGGNLVKNGIVDQEAMRRGDLRDLTGLSENELSQLNYDGLPRFLTRDNILALNAERKSMLPSAQLNSEAATLNTSYAELLDENQRLNFDLQNADDDLVREEIMSRRGEIQSQLQDIGQRISNMPIEEITNFARELINDVFPENKTTARSRLQYLDNETPVGLRIQPRVYETIRDILRDERDAVGAPLSDQQQSAVRSEWRRVSYDVARSINGNTYNGAAVANNIRRNPDRYDLGEYSAQIIDGIARQVEEYGIIDPRNESLPLIRDADSTLPRETRERLNNLFGNAIRSQAADPNFQQAIGQLEQYQRAYQNPPAQSAIRDLTEAQRLEAVGEIQRRIENLQQRVDRAPLVNTARPAEQAQDLGIVLHRMGDVIDEDYGTDVGEYVREALNTITYDIATDPVLYIERVRQLAAQSADEQPVRAAFNMVADRLVEGVRANTAAARSTAVQLGQPDANRIPTPRDVAEQVIHATAVTRAHRVNDLAEAINNEIRHIPTDPRELLAYAQQLEAAPLDLPGPIEALVMNNDQRRQVADHLLRQARNRIDTINAGAVAEPARNLQLRALEEEFNGDMNTEQARNRVEQILNSDGYGDEDIRALRQIVNDPDNPQFRVEDAETIADLNELIDYRLGDNVPARREPNNVGNIVQNLINQYPERNQVQALINDLERGTYDELPMAVINADEIVRDDTVSQILEQLEEYRDTLPAERRNENQATRHGTDVMAAYYEILRDNNQFRTAEEMDALRALPQLIRRPGATRQALGIGQFDTERANQLARIFEALYDARRADFARNGELPPPERHKDGGYIQSSKNRLLSPNTDEMRLALLKGK